MFLSVVVCTYNRKEYLLQCLKNIVESSIDSSKFEVLVIDNNSCDETASLVSEFVQKFKNIFYFKETNQGLSYARNRAMREARGDFLLYLDDDALVNSHGLEHLFDFLTQNTDAAVIGGKCVIKYLDKKPDWITKKGEDWIGAYDFGNETIEINRSSMKKRIVRLPIGACFCVRKDFLSSIDGFDCKLGRIGDKLLAGEETLVNFEALERGMRIVYLPGIFVDHLIQPERLTGKSLFSMTFYCGVSDYLLRKKLYPLLRILSFSLFRLAFLCKNVFDYLFYSLIFNKDKKFDARLLMSFNSGFFAGMAGFCKNG